MPVLLKNYGFVAANPVRASTRQRRQVSVNAPGATHRCLARTETNNPTALAGPSAWPQCMAPLTGPSTELAGDSGFFVSVVSDDCVARGTSQRLVNRATRQQSPSRTTPRGHPPTPRPDRNR
jgi:hypothetical protein